MSLLRPFFFVKAFPHRSTHTQLWREDPEVTLKELHHVSRHGESVTCLGLTGLRGSTLVMSDEETSSLYFYACEAMVSHHWLDD